MYRIAGVNIPPNKHIVIALTAVYGVGRSLSKKICEVTGVNPCTRAKDLGDQEIEKIRTELAKEEYLLEGNLRRAILMSLKRLQEIGCTRGIRHRRGLPVRGQRTKTNARTRKGKRRAVTKKK